MLSFLKSPKPDEIMGIPVRYHARAKNISLRVDARLGDVVLTLPKGASEGAAIRFINSQQKWIEKNRKEAQNKVLFADGERVFVNGIGYTIVHIEGRGVSRFEDDKLIVHGRAEHLARRTKDFLKKQAKELLADIVSVKAEEIDVSVSKVRVIDPKSRWGSCSPERVVMFSWRLILTPPPVMDYVVAHEVAHLVHLNHSKSFWKLCKSLAINAEDSRRWLRANGTEIMGYR